MKLMIQNTDSRIVNWGEPPWSNAAQYPDSVIIDIGEQQTPATINLNDYLYIAGAFVFSAHPPTIPEQDDVTAVQSRQDFRNLPNWATWTAEEAGTNIIGAIFNGQDAATIKANINTQLTDVTGATVAQINTRLAVIRTLFGNAVDAIITIRGIMVAMGKALVYLRNIVVRRQ